MEITGAVAFVVGALGFGVLMPAIIGYFSLQEKKLKAQRDIALQTGGDMRRELDETRAEVQRLRERMAVLERLATDGDRHLASEIDRLRPMPERADAASR